MPWQRVHFTGVGGVGMAGLAHILTDLGVTVSGTDARDSGMLRELRIRGLNVRVGHGTDEVGEVDCLVFSNAVPLANPERQAARDLGIPCVLRGAFLAEVAECFETVVAVGGSHGKSTTTAMIAHILREAGLNPGFLVGGSVNGWPRAAGAGAGRVLVTEVDESDGTQALIRSRIAVVTNVDDDHCWSLGGTDVLRRCFQDFAQGAACLVYWDDEVNRELFASVREAVPVAAADLSDRILPAAPGAHNLKNAALAVRVAGLLGVSSEDAWEALTCFPGVARRFSERFVSPDRRQVIVEDYAHHPTELRAALDALRERYPGHRCLVVFQPHRFERIARYAGDFAALLATVDRAVVTSPFAAWLDDAVPGAARGIAERAGETVCYRECDYDGLAAEILEMVQSEPADSWVVAVIGAGSIGDLVRPLCRVFGRFAREYIRERLRQACPALAVSLDRSWSELTTLGVGCDHPLIAEPATVPELRELLAWLAANSIPVQVLGNGSNLVGTDHEPVRVVISLCRGEFREIIPVTEGVTVGAGVPLSALVRDLIESGCASDAWLSLGWIPGTLGGAARMNAGADGSCLGDLVFRLEGICPGQVPLEWSASGDEIAWSYRTAGIPYDVILTRLCLRTGKLPQATARERFEAMGDVRRRRLPPGRSAGSVFRNPPLGAPAGRLLDEAGCKEMNEGGAEVSPRHANVIINRAGATEEDILILMCRMRARVLRHASVSLEAEVCFVNEATRRRFLALADIDTVFVPQESTDAVPR